MLGHVRLEGRNEAAIFLSEFNKKYYYFCRRNCPWEWFLVVLAGFMFRTTTQVIDNWHWHRQYINYVENVSYMHETPCGFTADVLVLNCWPLFNHIYDVRELPARHPLPCLQVRQPRQIRTAVILFVFFVFYSWSFLFFGKWEHRCRDVKPAKTKIKN